MSEHNESYSSPWKIKKSSYVVPKNTKSWVDDVDGEYYSDGSYIIKKLPQTRDLKRLKRFGLIKPQAAYNISSYHWLSTQRGDTAPAHLINQKVYLESTEKYYTLIKRYESDETAQAYDIEYIHMINGNFPKVEWRRTKKEKGDFTYDNLLFAFSKNELVGLIMPIAGDFRNDVDLMDAHS